MPKSVGIATNIQVDGAIRGQIPIYTKTNIAMPTPINIPFPTPISIPISVGVPVMGVPGIGMGMGMGLRMSGGNSLRMGVPGIGMGVPGIGMSVPCIGIGVPGIGMGIPSMGIAMNTNPFGYTNTIQERNVKALKYLEIIKFIESQLNEFTNGKIKKTDVDTTYFDFVDLDESADFEKLADALKNTKTGLNFFKEGYESL